MNPTEIAAWWGAGVATLLLLWDIYKWVTLGPRLRMVVQGDMLVMGDPARKGEKFVTVRVTNRGNQSTTLTNLCLAHFSSTFKKWLRRKSQSFVVTLPAHQIPHTLKPGGIWDGQVIQDEEIESLARDGYLEVELYHSHSRRPMRARAVVR